MIKYILILSLFLSGCQTIPFKINVELGTNSIKNKKEIIYNKNLSNDECILYAFKIEGWDYNWVGGYLMEFKQWRKNYTIDNFIIFFKRKVPINNWYWKNNLRKIRYNYHYLKEFGYK